jgi:hypothetical protein
MHFIYSCLYFFILQQDQVSIRLVKPEVVIYLFGVLNRWDDTMTRTPDNATKTLQLALLRWVLGKHP